MIGLMKNEKSGRIITKFVTAAPKCYSYCVPKDDNEIEDSKFIRPKGVKKAASIKT